MPIQEIYARHIKALPVADQMRLMALIAHGLATPIGRDLMPSSSLLELVGLGAEIWTGIDAQVYVDELRGDWDQRP